MASSPFVRSHLCCMVASLFLEDFNFFVVFGVCHIVVPWVIIGQTTAVYPCLALESTVRKVEVDVFVRVVDLTTNSLSISKPERVVT